jgi:hypothetical protein
MKRYAFVVMAGLFAGLVGMGCQVDVVEEPDPDAEEAEVGEAEQAMPFNCVGICVWEYRACIQSGGGYAECAAEREACKAVCDEQTCEPGEPGCCQGQPTCW